ncbi:MAG: hypothetical protein PHE49_06750 [bacterium]|nr:hypothetical protein [bacterium]
MPDFDFLITPAQRGFPIEVEMKRYKRIQEALGWVTGTIQSQARHVITVIPNGMEVYFLKPGKETLRQKVTNPNDMTPCVGSADAPYGFDEIWKQLSKVSVFDLDVFKKVLILLYRNAYFLDHEEVSPGLIRYNPNSDIRNYIQTLEGQVGQFMGYGLLGFLHFMDILGWNEDVKYHVENRTPTFSPRGKWKNGRINTLLTCIAIPYKTYLVVSNIRENSSHPQDIDWSLVYETMQSLARQGICPPTQKELLEWFVPYIF